MESSDNYVGPNLRISGSILVAEDGIDNQALIAARLRQTGLTVEIAPNGKIACEKALAALQNETPFDLILMDVQMPVMDGFSATLHLRGKGYRSPIIALTANAMERDRDKCLQAGCNDFVTKPIQLDKLFKAIGRYLAVEQIKEEPTSAEEASAAISRETQIGKFYEELPEQLQAMDEAIERQDRVRLMELIQLILGNAATAGLKDLAPDLARLWQAAQGETPWNQLSQAVADFSKEAQPKSTRQAA
jgi:CheY-like chemotaxis protein